MRVRWCGRKRYARRVVTRCCYAYESENHIDPARNFLNSFLGQVNWGSPFGDQACDTESPRVNVPVKDHTVDDAIFSR